MLPTSTRSSARVTAAGSPRAMSRSGPSVHEPVVGSNSLVLEYSWSSGFVPPTTRARPSAKPTMAKDLRGLFRLSASVQRSVAGSYRSAVSLPGSAGPGRHATSSPTARTVPSPSTSESKPVRARSMFAARSTRTAGALGEGEPGADGEPDDGAAVGADGATLGVGLAGAGGPHADTTTRLSRRVIGRRNVGVSMAERRYSRGVVAARPDVGQLTAAVRANVSSRMATNPRSSASSATSTFGSRRLRKFVSTTVSPTVSSPVVSTST